jgi:hypothetical protein
MTASNQIFLVMDAGTPVAAFTARREMQSYLRRRLDTFRNPLVCTFWGNQGPSFMTMTAALASDANGTLSGRGVGNLQLLPEENAIQGI